MSDKYSNRDILDIVDNEGLGYAVLGYLGPKGEQFEDRTLGSLWDSAYKHLQELDNYLSSLEEE